MELIVSHINTDFDALSSMVAAKLLYPEGIFVFPGAQEKRVREFIAEMYPIEHARLKDIIPAKVTRMIIVDTKSPKRLGPLADILSESGADVHIYDHHEHEDSGLRGSLELIDKTGATATLFVELLKERKLKPSPIEASLLCLGIYEETGNMLFPTTTDRDLEAAAWLLRCGASMRIVSTYQSSALSADEISLLSKLTQDMSETIIGGLKIVTATAVSDKYVGDAAHLAHRIMDMGYTDAVVIMIEMEGKILMVGRSRTPELNVADVLADFGGGGHPTAASATVKETPLGLLSERLMLDLKKAVKPGTFALDVMTSHVITILNTKTIKDAESAMTRYGVNVLPVVDSHGNYMGILTREVVEKALFLKLGKSQVNDFATTDALTAERYTPVSEIERDMVVNNQRFVAVLEDSKIKGAITRTDILRAMYNASLRRIGIEKSKEGQKQFTEKNLSSWICSRLPDSICDMLRLSGEIAQSLQCQAYLVGGSVRDLLYNRDLSAHDGGVHVITPDIDIVIEGDGIGFAGELARRLQARLHVHERFQTATLTTDAMKIDIATARTEYYETPAALPTVEMSSIKKDLYRRDFTINTLALKLNPDSFGILVDYFGAQRDIKERTVRVLHNLSFIEDPTRAFRAVRFAERFEFRISKHTENLIRSALKMEPFDKLSGTRLYDEMALIFMEKEPVKVIARLEHYGLLKVIHPQLKFHDEMEDMLMSVEATLSWFTLLFTDEQPKQTIIYLSAMLSLLKSAQSKKAMTRLMVPGKTARAVVNSTREARVALRKLIPDDPANTYEILRGLSLESILLAMAITKYDDRKKEVSRYLLEYRNVQTIINGNDLMEMGLTPGPEFSALLKGLLYARLRSEVSTREDEVKFIKAGK